MIEKRLASGEVAYYWNPHVADVRAGFSIGREKLGQDYSAAIERARTLNRLLDAWREGNGTVPVSPATSTIYGTLGWLFDRYRESAAFAKVSARSKPEYERALRRIEDVPTKLGFPAAQLPLASISTGAVDKLFEAVKNGPRGRRERQANLSMDIARRAWKIVQRLHSDVVPIANPFVGVEKNLAKAVKPAATRAEVYALAHALKELGEPHLGAAALICFEWHQRPEHVVARGEITWADWRPADMPQHVRIRHPKTGALVWLPLEDEDGPLYPDIEAYLAALPKLGLPIVLTSGERGASRPYAMVYAQRRVREAREKAGLAAHVTLDACRHGGMTELGDAGVSEQGIMALSGHKTPAAARPYVKKTDVQRLEAARLRRAWVSANG
ncbi:MAG: hypothetical protein EKK41_16950 [Hyphomicrobiales bacterium]|nr:MAG: hypothetical protein EKK41_16950 [Hyphomicrobiales bacterium]